MNFHHKVCHVAKWKALWWANHCKEFVHAVLTRKTQEKLVIQLGQDTVIVRIVDVSHNRVRLGIDAPKHISVHRDEVAQRIAKEEEIHARVNALAS